LREPETGALFQDSPLMDSLIFVIMLLFLTAGWAYGLGAETIKTTNDAMAAISKSLAGLGGLIFIFVLIAQFLAYFNYSNIAQVTVVLIVLWTIFYVLWYVIGIPWGPNAPVHV
jgi:aminobenzoyl-glutamate transport protein